MAALVHDAERISAEETPIEGWPEPEMLDCDLPAVPRFDPGLLPASLRPLVEDVADRMQVPEDFPATASMAALARSGIPGQSPN